MTEKKIFFTKMQALGNDFIVINQLEKKISFSHQEIQNLCNRRHGIGCDQLILIYPAKDNSHDFFIRFFNSDGSESFQCGNGLRCIARYLHQTQLSVKNPIKLATAANVYSLRLNHINDITVNMGIPILKPNKIPFLTKKISNNYQYHFEYLGQNYWLTPVSMGNPHAVINAKNIKQLDIATIGNYFSHHPQFPEQANIEFMEIKDRTLISIRIFERGAQETMACGSGACASVVAARLANLVDDEVQVEMPGGAVKVFWDGGIEHPIMLNGCAEWVFTGELSF